MVSVRNRILFYCSDMGRELARNLVGGIEAAGLPCSIATLALQLLSYNRMEEGDAVLAIITDDSYVSKDFWDLVLYTSQRRKWIILRLTDKYEPYVNLNSPNIRMVDYTGNDREVVELIESLSRGGAPSSCCYGDYSPPCSPCPAPSPTPRAEDTYGIWSPEVSGDLYTSDNSY